jgi:PHD/YefM family antitoxin component YafN of YafNO toxin-antitoxin module
LQILVDFPSEVVCMENNSTAPEIVIRDGEPVAVILSLAEYRELLEKAEDLEALRCLEEIRRKPLELRSLDAFLAERSQDV